MALREMRWDSESPERSHDLSLIRSDSLGCRFVGAPGHEPDSCQKCDHADGSPGDHSKLFTNKTHSVAPRTGYNAAEVGRVVDCRVQLLGIGVPGVVILRL